MARQDFSSIVESGLLGQVEKIVVDAHRDYTERRGAKWSRPQAYHWLHYEDADPISRLAEGVEKLRRRGAQFSAKAVDKACAEASKRGFLN